MSISSSSLFGFSFACGLSWIGLSACQPNAPTQSQNPTTPPPTQTEQNHFSGSLIRHENIGGDFTLTDGTGKNFSLNQLKNKVVLLSFGFTNCPDVCPTELLSHSDTIKQLGKDAEQVAVVFVSIDPERDTPAVIGRYVQQFNPHFIGLTDTSPNQTQLSAVKKQYRITAAKTDIKSDKIYNIDHTSGTYLLDKNGKVVVYEPYGSAVSDRVHDIQQLLSNNSTN